MNVLSNYDVAGFASVVRGHIVADATEVIEARGWEGDLLLCSSRASLKLMDKVGNSIHVAAGGFFVGALGNRESSVHASGCVPAEGLLICKETKLHLLGGSSGIVGLCEASPHVGNSFQAQVAQPVECVGLLQHEGRFLNVEHFALDAAEIAINVPMLLVGGTAADVGKTTLCNKLISRLSSEFGLRVGALKVTGSGGVVDSIAHKEAGARYCYDLVDAGMVSTYTNAQRFLEKIPRIVRKCAADSPDVIVCELGGDIIWGNNLAFLKGPWMNLTCGFAVICSDALSAIGTASIVHAELSGIAFPVFLVNSPFKNEKSFLRRMDGKIASPLCPCGYDGVVGALISTLPQNRV